MKTHHPKLKEVKDNRAWHLIDAEGVVLGKLSTFVADILRGKNKPSWHPSVDCGDNVVIINAEKVVLTGSKDTQKEYFHHTGFPGALRTTKVKTLREKHPERILEKSIAGMVPRNRLKVHVLGKLHVYAGAEHPHAGQNPQLITLK
jgi:large subunit ribosomal protein L13